LLLIGWWRCGTGVPVLLLLLLPGGRKEIIEFLSFLFIREDIVSLDDVFELFLNL
jgi:hypothetical protein